LKAGRKKITQRRREHREARRRSVRLSESRMNQKAKEAKRFTAEFAESTEKELGISWHG
jgi:hypothetical protein